MHLKPGAALPGGKVVPPHGSGIEHEEELLQTNWKDICHGRILAFETERDKDLLRDVVYAPLGRVPKHDSKGREKPVGRLIHD